ncbi:ZZ-type zinc finger-containing protein 3 isoform X1 [Corythoichthys intestinalis]|uniref:ZZ-type zinc finger-containing protein 3 isoform X1 n=1 Tax=Corythoichthys intestinalis TaxID=161448 RepID=UPI0025A5CD2F|nr:ZZ-type zinc finger-containing protein 3 isoform X1 [Corythoichthys intestinalis]XP_057712631.1 ZZ-type zinc finger-containing protein 3 isoform X1 [Corythoichthys intestinalis]XP_057712632.1 ZZ-type zinc finger-containing protein 3 isoform X1 [Corythoichthys intestinalis]
MAASRSSRVTRSSVGLNGLDENFCGRTLRNRSIAQPEETFVSPLPRARSPKKRQESRHDSRQVSKQQGSKKEDKQESKSDPKKEKTKQETREYVENELVQDSEQHISLLERLNDSKDSNSPLVAEQEPSSGPLKRSGSCLENDVSPEKSENCDKGNGAPAAPPLIKRAKRCSRPESQGHEEDAANPESPVSDLCKGNTCEDIPACNSDLAPASPALAEEEPAKDGREVCEEALWLPDSHKASNGLGDDVVEKLAEDSSTPASVTGCPTLLNGDQAGASSSPQPTVPCTNSSPARAAVAASEASPASFSPAPPEDPLPDLMVAREQEVEHVEVDVVGDPLCLAGEEQVMDSECDANGGPLTPVPDAASAASPSPATYNSNSGETTPPLAPTPPPTEPGCTPPSFAELYEHRYTLRTSPHKVSPAKACSPPRDNGREEGETAEEMDEDFSVPLNSLCLPEDKGTTSAPPGDQTCGTHDVGKEVACSQTTEEEEEEEPDVYYFESDHLALKHNKDYQRLLQTISVLEAQRTQAILDLETLARHQREALANPISFVEQLQKRVNLGLPCPQRVVQLPDLSWEQYTSGLGDFQREFCDKKRKTRRLKLIFDKGLPDRPKSPVEPKKECETSTLYSSLPTSDAPENGRPTQMIRGRLYHSSKPDTFNQLWTAEEQKKLEQLLLKFPPEEVESKRWQKIADELGNRTAKQVASRVQKYFIKLTKAGIPVPGRTPNLYMYTKKASSKRQHHHLNKHLRPSTFLTSYEPPVFMDDDDDDEERAAFYCAMHDPSAEDSDDDGIPLELRNLPEYKELMELKRLKKQKLQEIREDKVGVQHLGYKCDVCGMDPIQGVRWHCQDCPQDNAVDFCANCSDCLFKTETHKPTHHLDPVYQPETFLDRDYRLPQSTSYNYLDPNYFPANR